MSINSLSISYPDFRLNDTIDPEQFDVNNADLVSKINEVVTYLNTDIGLKMIQSILLVAGDGTVKGTQTIGTSGNSIQLKEGSNISLSYDPVANTITIAGQSTVESTPADASVITAKLADGAVTDSKLSSDRLATVELLSWIGAM